MKHPEPGHLSARIAAQPLQGNAALDQVTHWLFAFGPAAIASYRALALLATHGQARDRAVEEAAASPSDARLPYLRATVRDSIRLWPTSPAIFREATRPSVLGGVSIPAGTNILVFTPYLHRDETRLPFAHAFAPEIWLEGDEIATRRWGLVPFSSGPAICPAHHLVPMAGAMMLAALLRRADVSPATEFPLRDDGQLPLTLDHFRLRFDLRRRR